MLSKTVICLLIFTSLSCQSTNYVKMSELTQSEIKKMYVYDREGISQKVEPGKIKYCISDVCSLIICKEEKKNETGLECFYYAPETKSDSNVKIVDDPFDQTAHNAFQEVINQKDLGKVKMGVEKLCRKENVLCYLDKKYFPLDKEVTTTKYTNVVHRKTYTFTDFNKAQYELLTVVYEAK